MSSRFSVQKSISMWFKNIIAYRFTKPFSTTSEELETLLDQSQFRPCGKQELSSYGWASPLGRHGELLTHNTSGYLMICAKKEERLLPASVIKELLNEKVMQIEEAEHRKVYKKEKDTLKEEITFDLLPRAFTRTNSTFAFIAPKEGLLFVDASSIKRAEELISFLRTTIGSLPVVPPALKHAPASIMTSWLDSIPQDFELGDEAELSEPSDEGGIIRCKRLDLTSDEIQLHLDSGKQVNKLLMEWNEQLNFLLSDDFTIKRLRFSELILEDASDQSGDDAASQFDADFSIMAPLLCQLVDKLIEALGGEDLSRVDHDS